LDSIEQTAAEIFRFWPGGGKESTVCANVSGEELFWKHNSDIFYSMYYQGITKNQNLLDGS
jgi:hypothetical protein